MNNAYAPDRTITAARRALIIQRVLVDGWSSAKAAAAFGVSERQVDVWVADFRRHGMASLRQSPHRTAAVELVYLTVSRPLRGILRRISLRLRRITTTKAADTPPQPLPLRRSNEDGPG